MAFTISDAKALAESWLGEASLGDTIDGANAIHWGNECLRLALGSRPWRENTKEYPDAVAGAWYDLPDDFIRSVEVRNSDTELYTGYTIRNWQIKFDQDGTYTLTYTAHPDNITDIDATVPLPDIFLYPMARLMQANQLFLDPERGQEAQMRRAEFYAELNRVLSEVEFTSEAMRVEEVW